MDKGKSGDLITRLKEDASIHLLRKYVEENYSPKFIEKILYQIGLLPREHTSIEKKAKQIGYLWSSKEKTWIEVAGGKLFNDMSNFPPVTEPEEEYDLHEKDDCSTSISLKQIIEAAVLQKINLIELELAVDESGNAIEDKDLKIINNNIETIMKNINSLDSNVKQIARNFNRLVKCLVEEVN